MAQALSRQRHSASQNLRRPEFGHAPRVKVLDIAPARLTRLPQDYMPLETRLLSACARPAIDVAKPAVPLHLETQPSPDLECSARPHELCRTKLPGCVPQLLAFDSPTATQPRSPRLHHRSALRECAPAPSWSHTAPRERLKAPRSAPARDSARRMIQWHLPATRH